MNPENEKKPTDVKDILTLWFKLRETKKEVLPIYEISRINPWSYSVKRDMEEAFKLDPEGLTALLIMDNFRNDFFIGCGISIHDILTNPNFKTFEEDCRKLTEMLSEEHIVNPLKEFISSVSMAVKHMGIDREDVKTMVNDRYEMAILRRDSLRSMEILALHQFFQGETKQDHLTFLSDIHLFWNMNSLIRCAWQSPDGVSINLIKDPLGTSSYFAFVAKNGGNLTILTDKPKEAHPLSKYMSRRPERDFTSRVFRNHFPYGLLDLKEDHKGYLHPGDTSLVPLQEKPIKIGSISTMEPDEIIWTIMMFSLIDGKLYKENYHCAELSYTSDMIENPDIGTDLISQGCETSLMVRDYKPLKAPVLTTESIADTSQYEKYSGSGLHNWLFDRYKDQIPNNLLNGLLPSDESTLFLMPGDDLFLAPKDRVKTPWYNKDPILKADSKDYEKIPVPTGGYFIRGKTTIDDAVPLKKMTGDKFGSAQSLLNDYAWFARYNAAKFIQKKANEEFKARKEEVSEWVKKRIEANLDRIVRDIIKAQEKGKDMPEHCDHPCHFLFTTFDSKTYKRDEFYHTMPFLKVRNQAKYKFSYAYYDKPENYALHHPADAGCWFSEDAPCSYLLKAAPTDLKDLLYLTGCTSVEEFPDVLRHWHSGNDFNMERYTGNSILNRVDPMDWVLKNPWEQLKFTPIIGIGKKYLSKVKKELGL